ncbi:MAG: hypothetical protein EHM33_30600, partial [Chloroflexi bacterium]
MQFIPVPTLLITLKDTQKFPAQGLPGYGVNAIQSRSEQAIDPMKNIPSERADQNLYDVKTHAAGPPGRLPLQPEWLRDAPSGNVFGWTQD